MLVEIDKNIIEEFKKWLKKEDIEIKDNSDLAYELNKFIGLNLDLIK